MTMTHSHNEAFFVGVEVTAGFGGLLFANIGIEAGSCS